MIKWRWLPNNYEESRSYGTGLMPLVFLKVSRHENCDLTIEARSDSVQVVTSCVPMLSDTTIHLCTISLLSVLPIWGLRIFQHAAHETYSAK